MTTDIFVSYAHSNATQAQNVANELRALGYEVWLDDQLPAHRVYSEVIEEHLRAAKAVVVIWSDEAVKAQWVRAEADLAREAGTLVQMRIDDAVLPLPFNQIQSAQMQGWNGDPRAPGWRKVVASIAELTNASRPMPLVVPAANTVPGTAPTASFLRRMMAVAVAVLVVLGTAAYLLSSHMPNDSSVAAIGVATPTAATPFSGRPAIAVLPFDNFSPDPEQAFFADGLAEDLITRLSSFRGFPVIARNSSFKYRGGNLDLKKVSAELGARYLVEGSVRRDGDRIRVTAQLIDAAAGEHVWARQYDRQVKDLFALQDEISSTVAASLGDPLTRAEGKRAQQRGTSNLDAWSLFQLGVQRSSWDKTAARALFEQAVARDPRFATAQGWIALMLVEENMTLQGEVPRGKTLAAVAAARRAVDLDPHDAGALAVLGWTYLAAGDTQNALIFAERSVDQNPSLPYAWFVLGYTKWLTGKPEAVIAANEQVLRLDPQGPLVSSAYDAFAVAYWEMGRYDAGLDAGRRVVAASPDFWSGYLDVAMNAVPLGRLDEARAAITAARRAEPNFSLEFIQRHFWVSRPEVDERRNAMLRQAGLE